MSSATPRSMTAGARNILRSNDSASLWNYTVAPGWSMKEAEVLRKALMKFGVGNWSKIIESNCLVGKTNAQMNLQTQRMLGQQSTAEFAGLHIDPRVIGQKNSLIQGEHIRRKNGCIVNTGAKLSREEIRRRVTENREQYELPEEEWTTIELPLPEDPQLLLEAKRSEKIRLELELKNVQRQIAMLRKPGRKLELDSSESPNAEQDDDDQEEMLEDQPSGKRAKIEV
ncbi:hypothetical protein BGZ98_009310 [Dissophora globulifera]|uniref:Myb-like domain-containing protein n=1 Tax=Dissophora globulifera TaxID=979702 RepID=A0A9P6RL95_9FUNG|nr:hypothetical protein BGZ98_009310 [Dissophora globulifera]KAG0321155.1 hypothetical protein BGZ99_004098 [Dissophora globulifera]